MTEFLKYRNIFEDLLQRKYSGEDVGDGLKNLAQDTALAAKEKCDFKEYKQLANLFYQIQEILLIDYGIGSPIPLPNNSCLIEIPYS